MMIPNLSNIFSIVKIGGVVALGGLLLFGYMSYTNMKENLEIVRENNEELKTAIEQQKALLISQREDIESIRTSVDTIDKLNSSIISTVSDLNDRFNKINADGKQRDVGSLAISKPELIENIINNATEKSLRCFEIASGAEVDANENNSECPNLIGNSSD